MSPLPFARPFGNAPDSEASSRRGVPIPFAASTNRSARTRNRPSEPAHTAAVTRVRESCSRVRTRVWVSNLAPAASASSR